VTQNRIEQTPLFTTFYEGAKFSPCRTWRYDLWRKWGSDDDYCSWILLNPSTANESENDPTIRRCITFSKAWGYSGLHILNVFGFRATDPSDMKKANEPIGTDNNKTILKIAKGASRVVCGWGDHGQYKGRAEDVVRMLSKHEIRLSYLDLNKSGEPRHPLYIKGDTHPKTLVEHSGIDQIDMEKYIEQQTKSDRRK